MIIDLGKTPEPVKTPEAPSKQAKSAKPKAYYPTIYLSGVSGLESLPEGEFEFEGIGRVVSKTVNTKDGKKTCSCEIEIKSIECEECEVEDETIEDAFDKVAAKKSAKPDKEDEED